MRTLLTPVVVAAVLTAPVVAQEGNTGQELRERSRKEALEKLASQEPMDAAWGAYLAGHLGAAEDVPAVRQALVRWTSPWAKEGETVRLYLLDALIRLDADLPGEELAPQIHGDLVNPALVLASRDASQHGALLFALLQEHWLTGMWTVRLAAGNLLAGCRYPRFAAFLLDRLELSVQVTVYNEMPDMIGVGVGGAGGAFGGVYRRLPKGWPPLSKYSLTLEAAPGAVLLAEGPRPVYWTRKEDEGRVLGPQGSTTPTAADAYAFEWLFAMANTDVERIDLPRNRYDTVIWEGPEPLLARVATLREKTQAGFQKLRDALVAQGALTQKEARQYEMPKVVVELTDKRHDKTIPLPDESAVGSSRTHREEQ